jgi:hypothetical protein
VERNRDRTTQARIVSPLYKRGCCAKEGVAAQRILGEMRLSLGKSKKVFLIFHESATLMSHWRKAGEPREQVPGALWGVGGVGWGDRLRGTLTPILSRSTGRGGREGESAGLDPRNRKRDGGGMGGGHVTTLAACPPVAPGGQAKSIAGAGQRVPRRLKRWGTLVDAGAGITELRNRSLPVSDSMHHK